MTVSTTATTTATKTATTDAFCNGSPVGAFLFDGDVRNYKSSEIQTIARDCASEGNHHTAGICNGDCVKCCIVTQGSIATSLIGSSGNSPEVLAAAAAALQLAVASGQVRLRLPEESSFANAIGFNSVIVPPITTPGSTTVKNVDPDDSSSSSNTPLIIGCTVGGLFLIIVMLVFVLSERKRTAELEKLHKASTVVFDHHGVAMNPDLLLNDHFDTGWSSAERYLAAYNPGSPSGGYLDPVSHPSSPTPPFSGSSKQEHDQLFFGGQHRAAHYWPDAGTSVPISGAAVDTNLDHWMWHTGTYKPTNTDISEVVGSFPDEMKYIGVGPEAWSQRDVLPGNAETTFGGVSDSFWTSGAAEFLEEPAVRLY